LSGAHAPPRNECRINAKQQGLNGSVVCGQAINWEVSTGWHLLDPNPFCLAHGCEQWKFSGLVGVNANPEVDFGWTRVCLKGLGEPEDGVAGGEWNFGKRGSHGSDKGERDEEGNRFKESINAANSAMAFFERQSDN
jgi:hypothetical protein